MRLLQALYALLATVTSRVLMASELLQLRACSHDFSTHLHLGTWTLKTGI